MGISKELREKKFQQKMLRAGIMELWWDKKLENFVGDKDAKSIVIDTIKTLHKNITGLFLIGANGTGKSYLMNEVLKAGLYKGLRVKSVSLSGIVEMFTAGWYDNAEKKKFQEEIMNVDILGVDDVGKEFRNKSGLGEIVFDTTIRYRVQRKKMTILTSNLQPAKIREVYGGSLASLLNEFVKVVKVVGNDYRKVIKKNQEEIKKGEL